MIPADPTGERGARWLPEAAKGDRDHRSPAARDRARVLHSAALRRLAGKTQVVGPGEDAEVTGVPRTRLTHSLEVAQIGRDLAADLGLDPDVVDTAGLAHDIGHPPFGHNGERALDVLADGWGIGGFEANAQTLRLLTRLEPKTLDDGRCRGLNLTRASLDACVKYPWRRDERPATGPAARKFGVYDDDAAVFAWVRAGVPPERARARCVEAQVMDWADDVAYSVHDVEDAVLAGRMSLAELSGQRPRAELVRVAAQAYADGVAGSTNPASTGDPVGELERAGERLAALPAVAATVAEEPGSLSAAVALKRLTSVLVGRFVSAVEIDKNVEVAGGDGGELVVPGPVRAEVALLKAAALRHVMRDPARLDAQRRERTLVTELGERLLAGAPGALDPSFVPAWHAGPDDAARRRVVVDQVAVLTDAQARTWCTRLREHGPVRP